MKIGMLWFDNDQTKSVDQKILGAIKYYQDKYGKTPTLCYVNPIQLIPDIVYPIKTISSRSVMVNHFWIGVEDAFKL
jgi:hypothetical protein